MSVRGCSCERHLGQRSSQTMSTAGNPWTTANAAGARSQRPLPLYFLSDGLEASRIWDSKKHIEQNKVTKKDSYSIPKYIWTVWKTFCAQLSFGGNESSYTEVEVINFPVIFILAWRWKKTRLPHPHPLIPSKPAFLPEAPRSLHNLLAGLGKSRQRSLVSSKLRQVKAP